MQRQIVELGLANAWIVGSVPVAVLRAYYEKADVFVTASDHEGFCVPLLEAMSFDVPVVARATSAIPETLGGAGILARRLGRADHARRGRDGRGDRRHRA